MSLIGSLLLQQILAAPFGEPAEDITDDDPSRQTPQTTYLCALALGMKRPLLRHSDAACRAEDTPVLVGPPHVRAWSRSVYLKCLWDRLHIILNSLPAIAIPLLPAIDLLGKPASEWIHQDDALRAGAVA